MIKKMVKGKSGISAVVATILILLITIVTVTIIWIAVLPMILENVSFDEGQVDLTIVSNEGYTVWNEENKSISVHVRRG